MLMRVADCGNWRPTRFHSAMDPLDLHPYPFCAHEAPTLVVMGGEKVERVSVVCSECGAVGPMTTADRAGSVC